MSSGLHGPNLFLIIGYNFFIIFSCASSGAPHCVSAMRRQSPVVTACAGTGTTRAGVPRPVPVRAPATRTRYAGDQAGCPSTRYTRYSGQPEWVSTMLGVSCRHFCRRFVFTHSIPDE